VCVCACVCESAMRREGVCFWRGECEARRVEERARRETSEARRGRVRVCVCKCDGIRGRGEERACACVCVCESAMRGEAGRVCVARGRACVESEARRGRVHVCVCVSAMRGEGVCIWRVECEARRGESEAWKGRGEKRTKRLEGGARRGHVRACACVCVSAMRGESVCFWRREYEARWVKERARRVESEARRGRVRV